MREIQENMKLAEKSKSKKQVLKKQGTKNKPNNSFTSSKSQESATSSSKSEESKDQNKDLLTVPLQNNFDQIDEQEENNEVSPNHHQQDKS